MTTTDTITVVVRNENCIMAGTVVDEETVERYRLENNGELSGDWTVFEGTPAELIEIAKSRVQYARSGGGGQYDRRVASNLLEAAGLDEDEIQEIVYGKE